MTDLVSLMAQSGMSLEDLEILRQATGGGQVDLGLGRNSTLPIASKVPVAGNQTNFFSAGRPDLTSMPAGPSGSSRGTAARKVGNQSVDALAAVLGLADDMTTPAAKAVQSGATKLVGTGVSTGAGPIASIGRFAASPAALTAAKVGTGIGALGGVLGAADVIAGNDSLGNKAMDTVAMGIGGALGAVGGPMGIAAGAGLGKMASDATQFVLGGGKSAEQRKMEEALAALRGGQI